MPHFLPAIFAFLFWGKTTAESEDRTRHSSWMRTLIFLVLTICVGLIYVKTLEILTLTNYIDIRAAKNVPSSEEENQDLAQIAINTKIDDHKENEADRIKKNILQGNSSGTNADSPVYDLDVYYGKYSSSRIAISLDNETSPALFNHITDKKSYTPVPDVPWNKILAYPENLGFSKTFNIDSLCTLLKEDYDQQYFVATYQSSVLDFRPLQILTPSIPYDHLDSAIYNKSIGSHTKNAQIKSLVSEGSFEDEGVLHFDAISHKRSGSPYYYDKLTIENFYAKFNNLRYITAGDISQAVFQLQLHSDIKITELLVNFSSPVEFVQLPFTPDEISPYGFRITNTSLIRQLLDKDVRLFVKFPAMANKQLVRSLILTTLLTALASLFLTNLYFCIRRAIRIRLGREERAETEEKRMRKAKMAHNALIIILLLALLLLTWRVCNGIYFYMTTTTQFWFWSIVAIILILFIAIEYLLYRYAKSEMPTSPSDTD